MPPKVAIIILNWNQTKDTVECLNSLQKCDYANFQIILVDNASQDTTYIKQFRKNKNIRFIFNPRNLGFTGGNNVGIRYAMHDMADYVLLLNNDTIVEPDFLTKLIEESERQAATGIASPKIMSYQDHGNIWFVGGFYLPFIKKPYHKYYNQKDIGQADKISKVDWVSGCAMLIKRKTIESIGVLDDDYFCNYEDVDYCGRAKKAGFDIILAPQAKIYHKFAASMGGKASPFYTYFRTRNNLLFFKKTKQWLPLIINAAIFPIYSLYESLKNKQFGSIYATFLGIWDFLIEKYGYGSAGKFSK